MEHENKIDEILNYALTAQWQCQFPSLFRGSDVAARFKMGNATVEIVMDVLPFSLRPGWGFRLVVMAGDTQAYFSFEGPLSVFRLRNRAIRAKMIATHVARENVRVEEILKLTQVVE